MKRLVILLAAACIMMSCEMTSTDVAPHPDMTEFYQESLQLNTVTPDSVMRFANKVNAFVNANPSAKDDTHYADIINNISMTLHIHVADFNDINVSAIF